MGNFRGDRSGGGFSSRGRSAFSSSGRPAFGRGGGRSFGGGTDRGPRPSFEAVCSNCGKECTVPFRPTNGKPVYCSDCFEKMGNRGQDSRRPQRTEFRPQAAGYDQSKIQLDAINAKLDKILNLLQPKIEIPTVQLQEVKEESVEVKKPKVKKAVKKAASSKKK